MKNYYALVSNLMLLLIFTVAISNSAFSQRTVQGKVLDGAGEALIGASVLVKGTTIGTITDIDGNYTITLPQDQNILQVSYTGYADQEIDMTGQSNLTITLSEDSELLDEIVVIGYGRQKKSVVTGAVGKVDVEQLASRSPGRLESSIQGTVAGIAITPNSGAPDAGFSVRIRGTGSNGPSEPLYIVDGMRTRDISFIESANIESLEILKDAASASIYGAEGANGVVLITTKDGSGAESGISYGFQYGQQSYRGNLELMNSTQWRQYLIDAGAEGVEDINTTQSTDWLDNLFENAPLMRHTLGFDGGNEKLSYHVGANYFDQAGIVGGSDDSEFKRLSANLGLKAELSSLISVGANVTLANESSVGGGAANVQFGDVNVGGLISNAILFDPSQPVSYTGAVPDFVNGLDQGLLTRDENGNIYSLSQVTDGEIINPNITLSQSNGDGVNSTTLFGSIYGTLNLTDDLSVTSRFGFDNNNGTFHNWNPSFFATPTRNSVVANSVYNFFSTVAYQWENFANYNIDLNDGIELDLLGGVSIFSRQFRGVNGNASGLAAETQEASYLDGSEASSSILGQNTLTRLQSYFGRATLNISDKYVFMASLRNDGTSIFRGENQRRTYPGISAGWIISRESFLDNTGVLNYAKLRASWGQAGSLSGVQPGEGQELLQAIFQYAGGIAVDPVSLSNPDLTWETSEQINIGLDLGLIADKLTFSVDYFNKKTRDLITTSSPPGFIGNAAPVVNAGTMVNRGFEFELGYKNSDNPNFKYRVSANVTAIENEVTELNAVDILQGSQQVGVSWNPTAFEVGQPAWYFRGYQTDGLNDDGSPNIIDNNGDGVISPEDYGFIGSPHPSLLYGGIVNLEFGGGFDFTLFVQGQAGNDILMGFNRTDRARGNKPTVFLDDDFFAPNLDGPGYESDFLVFDGSFLRVKQIQLGYDLSDKVSFLNNLRFYVSLEDYFTLTDYPGLDPEIGSTFSDAIGIDRGTYPIPGRIIFGATTNF